MAKTDDLTVREVNEAKSYGLNPDQYDELRDKFEKRQRERLMIEVRDQAKKEAKAELRVEIGNEMRPGIREDVDKEMRPKLTTQIEKELRAKLPDELRPKLREDLLPELRKQVETELSAQIRATAKVEAEQGVARQVPTVRDRTAFRDFIREEEVSCLTQANAASTDAEDAERSLRWGRRLRVPVAYGLFAALPILGYILFERFGTGPGLWSFLVPAVFAAIAFAGTLGGRQESLKNKVTANRKVAADYWVLAERAKKLRMVTAEMATTKEELRKEVDSYTENKQRLDDNYFPAAESLAKSRVEVRDQLMSEVDPDKLLRVASEPEPVPEELDEELPAPGVRRSA